MAALTASDVAGALKELYPDDDVREVTYKNAPAFALIEKDEEASGELYKCPLIYGHPQGRSATFNKAQTNQRPGKYAGFEVTYVDDYGTAAISGRTIDATRNDRGAFVRALKQEMDGALHQTKRSAHHALYRNGGGAIGQVGAYTATQTTFTLLNVEDVVFFEVGQVLQSATTDGTSGAARSGTGEISKVDRDTGIVTGTAAWDTAITGFTVNDYLFVDGDFGLKMLGFDAWIPSTAPTATAFYGVDRSVDATRLGGVRYDGSGQPIDEALVDAIERVTRHGGSPDTIFLHTKQFARLIKRLETKTYGMRKTKDELIGFKTLKFVAPGIGEIDVIPDMNCQVNVAWILQMDTWTLASMGRIPKMLDDDGLPYLRQASADGVELRTVYRGNPACKAPGWNGRCALAA